MQADPNPADLQTTAAETRPAQAGARALWEELATLDHQLAEVRREDRDPVDRVVGPHHQGRTIGDSRAPTSTTPSPLELASTPLPFAPLSTPV